MWRPGADKNRPFLVTPDQRALPKEAHHLIVTADPMNSDGMSINFSTVTPAEYDSQWWFFADDRQVSFGTEVRTEVRTLAMTDDEAADGGEPRVKYRRSSPRTVMRDLAAMSLARDRKGLREAAVQPDAGPRFFSALLQDFGIGSCMSIQHCRRTGSHARARSVSC